MVGVAQAQGLQPLGLNERQDFQHRPTFNKLKAITTMSDTNSKIVPPTVDIRAAKAAKQPSATSPRMVRIFDTTLRDGEQSPGASMNITEKLEIAQALVDMGVDIIEAGFPIASPGDFEAVRQIAANIRGSTICGLARCNDADIDRAWEALKGAPQARIHVFLATSAIHREFKLKMDKDEIVRRAVAGVKRAVGYCDDVEFSPEDAARTEVDFLCQVVEAAIAAGATTVNIPDTVGYATPAHYGQVITHAERTRAEYRQSRDQRALPQRSRSGGREQSGRRRKRRRASRMHHQRHRRTRRQLLAGRSRHGPAHAARFLSLRHAHQHAAAGADQPAGFERHRHAGAAEQSHRRPQCVRARSRHPSRRHAERAANVRNHAAGRCRTLEDRSCDGQAQRPRCAGRSRGRSAII